MEESRPPVPAKDPPKDPPKESANTADMDIDFPQPAITASNSKRKREAHDEIIYDLRNGRLEAVGPDVHTPKRSRSSLRQSDGDLSDDSTPMQPRNLRRKKGMSNLSNVNLRHAAEQQFQTLTRESRFQEGSLSDKPSEKPPSAFTRIIRTDSGNIQRVDELMADYHEEQNGIVTPTDSVEAAVEREKAELPQRVADITQAQQAAKEENRGFFRFGRSLAANFHPIQLWNKLWQETKDELTQQNLEEAERKRRLKAEAEAKYAQMKQAGQFTPQYIQRASGEMSMTRDSGIVMNGSVTSLDPKRNVSDGSRLAPPTVDNSTGHSESEAPEPVTVTKPSKSTLRSRFGHFKKPSLSNIRTDLKRVKSDFNLAGSLNRESSSSVSPVKTDAETSTLRKSYSRIDLKKQHKLSKRVSDLEAKLATARRELGEALTEASPMPKLGSKYERFTPVSSVKIPRMANFMPGRLPTLPSERLLDPALLGLGLDDEEQAVKVDRNEAGAKLEGLFEPPKGTKLNGNSQIGEDEDDDTIRIRGARTYPPRASSLFGPSNDNTEPQVKAGGQENHDQYITSELTELTTDAGDMDPNSIANLKSDGQPDLDKSANYADLDAKLKALDKNVRAAKKASRPRKRKSRPNDDDAEFKLELRDTDEEDSEVAEETPRKKGKPGRPKKETNGNSPQAKKSGKEKGKRNEGAASSPMSKKKAGRQTAVEAEPEDVEMTNRAHDEDDSAALVRTSLDSQGQPLEPLYEEEEDSFTVPLNDAPSKPTAKATPARLGRSTLGSRSNSPAKRTVPGVEETDITRAATAAQDGRRGRSASPPAVSRTVDVDENAVSVIPGESVDPKLPRGAIGSFESLEALQAGQGAETQVVVQGTRTEVMEKGSFEWPEDVF